MFCLSCTFRYSRVLACHLDRSILGISQLSRLLSYKPVSSIAKDNKDYGPQSIDVITSLKNPFTLSLSATSKISENVSTTEEVKSKNVLINSKFITYLELSKYRLSGLVVLTSMAGYGVAPFVSFDPLSFTLLSIGTGLTAACANSLNQTMEVAFDAKMKRTQARPLVRQQLTPAEATRFAFLCGAIGTASLCSVNPLTAVLGLSNILLYSYIYTPMKRKSIANTWVGAVVGAIPPLMGWAAAMGSLDINAFILAMLLYSWQFPHFNALSWNIRKDYTRAGYRMMCNERPNLCRSVALRHAWAIFFISYAAPLLGLTSWGLICASTPLNIYMVYASWQFYKYGDSRSSRTLFRFTLLHLPFMVALFLIFKKRPKVATSAIDCHDNTDSSVKLTTTSDNIDNQKCNTSTINNDVTHFVDSTPIMMNDNFTNSHVLQSSMSDIIKEDVSMATSSFEKNMSESSFDGDDDIISMMYRLMSPRKDQLIYEVQSNFRELTDFVEMLYKKYVW